MGLDRRHDREQDEQQDGQAGEADRKRIAADEFARNVGPACGCRDHRQSRPPVPEIRRELLDGRITPRRFAAHGHERDVVEVAAQLLGTRVSRC